MYQLILVTALLVPANEADSAQARAAAALALSQADPVAADVCECGGNPDKCVCAFGTCFCLTCDPSYTWKRYRDGDARQVMLWHDGKHVGVYTFADGKYWPIMDGHCCDTAVPLPKGVTIPAEYLRNFEESCHKRAAQQSQGQSNATYQGYELLPPGATYYADPGAFGASGGCANGSCSGGSGGGRLLRRR